MHHNSTKEMPRAVASPRHSFHRHPANEDRPRALASPLEQARTAAHTQGTCSEREATSSTGHEKCRGGSAKWQGRNRWLQRIAEAALTVVLTKGLVLTRGKRGGGGLEVEEWGRGGRDGGLGAKRLCAKDGQPDFRNNTLPFSPTMVALVWGGGGSAGGSGVRPF